MKTANLKPMSSQSPSLQGARGKTFCALSVLCACMFMAFAPSARGQFVSTLVTNVYSPNGVALDPSQNVYITEVSNCIVKYDPSSQGTTLLAGRPGFVGTNDGLGGGALFNDPAGIAYVPSLGGLVVVDEGNHTLRLVSLSGLVSTLAGTPGKPGTSAPVGPIALSSAVFNSPTSIAVDPNNGNVYVADSGNNAIRVIDTTKMTIATLQITNRYSLYFPQGMTTDGTNMYVADTKNDTICVIQNIAAISNLFAMNIAGSIRHPGVGDDPNNALNARLTTPVGVQWDTGGAWVWVADTGNNSIRKLYPTNSGWGIETVSGSVRGYVDGAPSVALFNQPVQIMSDAQDLELYTVDKGNNAVRIFQATPPQPPLPEPNFGFVTFPLQGTPPLPLSLITYTTNFTFNDFPPLLAIDETDKSASLYYSVGKTDPFHSQVPDPTAKTGTYTPIYPGNFLPQSQISSVLNNSDLAALGFSDLTMKAVAIGTGRGNSAIQTAYFHFICANPTISGNNAASITLTDPSSPSARLYYTFDGTDPTNRSSIPNNPDAFPTNTPWTNSGATISVQIQSNSVLSVRAYNVGFHSSATATKLLSLSNYFGNQISFGFETGEGSANFKAVPGQIYLAPVTLSLLTGARMYSLQFNVTVSNLAGSPLVAPGAFDFESTLVKPIPGAPAGSYTGIAPEMFVDSTTNWTTNYVITNFVTTNLAGNPVPTNATLTNVTISVGDNFTNGIFKDVTDDLLGVGWLQRATKTNLYDATTQDLIKFSLPKDTLFDEAQLAVVLGAYEFSVPAGAAAGQQYQIQIGRPSASADGVGVTAALITTPTNGSTGAGPINSFKRVTVTQGGILTNQLSYLVGDVNSFRWFNAGEFGDGNLDNSDVENVFESAIYGLNYPIFNSDLFRAMDSSNASTNDYPALFTGTGSAANAVINSLTVGDGKLDISDVYVTFRRSLDPALTWYRRYWDGFTTHVVPVVNGSSYVPAAAPSPLPVTKSSVPVAHPITVGADQVIASAGSLAVVPFRVISPDPTGLPVRVLMFDFVVEALDGSPAITESVSLSPAGGLGAPHTSDSKAVNDFAAAWLDTSLNGVSGVGVIGNLLIPIPANANASAAYRVRINSFSASPNGLGVYTATVQNGLITLSDRSASSWNDGISDQWRLLRFGTLGDPNSAAVADPDGDGASNWQEYIAGTDPMDPTSVFKLQTVAAPANGTFTLQWPTVSGKHYTVQCCSSLGSWTTVTNAAGTGGAMSVTTSAASQAKFFRALVQ